MLKNPSTSAILQSRKLVNTVARIHIEQNSTLASSNTNMSAEVATAAPASAPRRSPRPGRTSQEDQSMTDRKSNSRPNMAYFPLSYKDAVCQWWSNLTPTVAERNVVSCIPHLREALEASGDPVANTPSADHPGMTQTDSQTDPYGPRVWKSTMVPLSGKNRALNEFSVTRVGEQVDDTLVMLHGYGAGLGFFYKNFESISRSKGWKLYALDMLGMGNSSRPPFKIHAKDAAGKITEAEDWFVDALEEWRKIRKLERFTLLGHSLGGYLAVSYALKYPGHLNKLILASPVGVPEDPYAVNADMPEPTESTFQEEFTVDQEATTTSHESSLRNAKQARAANNQQEASAPRKRPYPGWLVWLWDANVSPFSIIRLSGPLGPRFVSGWTSRRFDHLPADEKQTLHDYAYSLFRQRGSGEYALPYLLAPGAHARRPIINRVHELGRQVIKPSASAAAAEGGPAGSASPVRETGFPVVFMYGENDWMDVAVGLAAEERLRQARERALARATEDERRRENGAARVVVVPAAGHHLYLDNPDEFNRHMRDELDETRRHTALEKARALRAGSRD